MLVSFFKALRWLIEFDLTAFICVKASPESWMAWCDLMSLFAVLKKRRWLCPWSTPPLKRSSMSTGPVSRADQVAAAEWENHQLQQQARQQAAVAAANKQAQQDPNQSSIYSQPQQAHRAAASASEQHYRSLKYPSYDSASNYSLSQHQQR